MWLDLSKPWPVPPGSVSHIYADNVIEHFSLSMVRAVLKNAFDVLAPEAASGWRRRTLNRPPVRTSTTLI